MIGQEAVRHVAEIIEKYNIRTAESEYALILSDEEGREAELRSFSPSVLSDDMKIAAQIYPEWHDAWYETDNFVFFWYMNRIANGESTSRYSDAGIRVYDESDVKYYGFNHVHTNKFHMQTQAWTMDHVIDSIEDVLHFERIELLCDQDGYYLQDRDGSFLGDISINSLEEFISTLDDIQSYHADKIRRTALRACECRTIPV